VFNNTDRVGDIIEPGAFKQTLYDAYETKSMNASNVLWPLLHMHEDKEPIGGVTEAKETPAGLLIECFCDMDTQAGREAFSGISKGYTGQLSIGYNIVRSTRDQKGIRHLQQVRMLEMSVVTTNFAANPLANIDPASVKSASPETDDWKKQRPGYAPYVHPTHIDLPEMPERKRGESEREWTKRINVWDEINFRTSGLPPIAQLEEQRRKAEQDAELAKQRAQRVRNGTATLAERKAEAARTGRTPDGRKLADYDSATVYKLHAALVADIEIDEHGNGKPKTERK
jgi:HK97 family phage prohead protease